MDNKTTGINPWCVNVDGSYCSVLINRTPYCCDSCDKKVRPPIGLKPKYIHEAQRINDIARTIDRYLQSNKPIPVEWIDEYNELIKIICKR